ncbi:glycoside hydrolase family 88 protein [Thomasclavelia spiroformis]|uniref:glycoside hydrolase family 88 protein n=1 Tax=Thomasclavelia spiroformis TaxID=29348 RepID=UPI0024308310|nr:glycoside hydrolase family 88 protein [Thomasclavelia spiroformis]
MSWVRLKDLPISEETIPVDGRRKFSALTEFKVWGKEASYEQATLPSAKNLVNLAQKVNDYWIKTGGNTGNDASNYNHGHSITSEFWAPSVFYTGNMEAYYLTGDENYTDYANRWGSNNIYNGSAWNTKADNSRIGKYFPDNHTSFQTYLDMFSITSDKKFDPNDEKIKNVVPIMNEMEQMDINDLKTKKGYWDRIDFFYMELPNWTKMYLLTGEEKWLDKLRELYDDRKAELYDEETGLFYRDKNYIFNPNAQYDPNGDGNNQKISPNGKKILWSRGNGWAMAALTKVLQDLPDSRQDDRKEYEAVFKKMAATLIEVQGDDGFWRMNLDDYDHDIRPETSGTVFFAYGLTWGINNGLLDKETYYPAVKKAFLGLNANAIRPDGLVGRSELISAYPNPKCALGIGSSQSYAPAATVMFLSELSKLVEQGYVTDDVEPALDKKMISAVAVKEDSKYAVVNSEIRELVTGTELKTIKNDNKIYVPQQFIEEVYGQDIIDKMTDKIIYENITYLSMNELSQVTGNLKLSSVKNNITVISYKTNLFNSSIDSKLIDLLDIGLTEGKYPKRPEYPIRFDYTKPEDELKPSKDALISVEANTSGAISASRLIGPSTKDPVNVEFDMVTVLSPSQTNAIVGIGSSDSSYTGYSQVPIIIRMYRDGKIGAYNGNGYVQSNVEFEKNKKYHLRVSINLEEKTYDAYVTPTQQEEIQIATNYAFRSTAKVPEDIGKIYLFNNDQQAGKYWLEGIYLEANETDKVALRIALDLANAITDEDLKDVILVVADEFKAARDNANEVYNNTSATQEEVNNAFDRLASAMHMLDFKQGDKTALKAFIDKVSGLDSSKYTEATWTQFNDALTVANNVYNDENAMQEEVDATYQELVTVFLNLRLIPDKSLLEDLINKAEGLNLASYSKATVQVVNDALANAKNVLANENASQKEVDNAKATLEKAIAGLQANPSIPSNVDNTVSTPVNNGDTTASVKTGDDVNMLGTLGLISSLSVVVFLKKKKINKIK